MNMQIKGVSARQGRRRIEQDRENKGTTVAGRTISGCRLSRAWFLSSEIWNCQLHCDWKGESDCNPAEGFWRLE